VRQNFVEPRVREQNGFHSTQSTENKSILIDARLRGVLLKKWLGKLREDIVGAHVRWRMAIISRSRRLVLAPSVAWCGAIDAIAWQESATQDEGQMPM